MLATFALALKKVLSVDGFTEYDPRLELTVALSHAGFDAMREPPL